MSEASVADPISPTRKRFAADSLSRSVVLLGTLIILQRGIGFLRSLYVCGQLTPAEVGQWDLAFHFLSIVAPLAVLGIPGSFGRYVAHYEHERRERSFLKLSLISCLALVLFVCALIWQLRWAIARYFFGGLDQVSVVALLAIGLPFVVIFNFATSWFTGKRMNGIVFRLQFTQTLFFACLCVLAFQFLATSAKAVVISYLLACLFAVLLAIAYAVRTTAEDYTENAESQPSSILGKILPFAVWVWLSNALFNLFVTCDRILLVSFHPDPDADIQALIGQYHTACVFPLLLMSIGAMAGSMLIPYLSNAWERGERGAVQSLMNLMIKSIGLLCMGASVAILVVAPLLFGGLWQGKFATGEALLPLALTYCSFAAMSLVAQKYFWCIEKTWFSSLLLALGLATNFFLGWVLIRSCGLEGVVLSTLAAHAIVLIGVLFLCCRYGLAIDGSVVLIGFAVLTLCAGRLAACLSFALLVWAAVFTELIYTEEQKTAVIGQLKSIRFPRPGVSISP